MGEYIQKRILNLYKKKLSMNVLCTFSSSFYFILNAFQYNKLKSHHLIG